ncbi:aldehyde dehydrogenase [Gordonia sp. TBRC 11910]|uniref:Aldehyde dehydrogenase n=1 Tax=Gordonia asplenii TaxID=2725283 RepID=A0A848KW90_9ACTN|nr:aldehyde dehydrogenase family protein [Gordonia asplenii]NMO02936.1 aldehyde dehydrogenase [Gordonia asplenii]
MTSAIQTAPAEHATTLPDAMHIDGAAVVGTSGHSFTHINPANGQAQVEFQLAGPAEVTAAVESSARAQQQWRLESPTHRREKLQALARALRENIECFAELAALEIGTPLNITRWAADASVGWLDYYAGWTDKVTGDTIPVPREEGINFTLREPVGVVAKILTWNLPIASIAMAVAPALAAGCSVILKPAEQAGFQAVRFAQLCDEVGLPAGLVNTILGDHIAGDALVRHPGVAKVSFTGGGVTARKLQQAASENLTPLVLELGGKSANIIFADADLEAATSWSTIVTTLSGQGCSLPSRILAERSVYDDVVARVAAALEQVTVGDPYAADTMMGPVFTQGAFDRILGVIDESVGTGGATCVTGGAALDRPGFFIAPTLLRDVDPASAVAQEEIFGPVVCVIPFDDDDDAVRIANSTPYGLAAYVHTADLSRAMRLCRDLQAGGIGVNGKLVGLDPTVPFGGIGASGYGREGGREGLDEFLTVKNVAIKF